MSLISSDFGQEQNIKIEQNLNSQDIQLWNILLYHAYDNLFKEDEYSISVSELLILWSKENSKSCEDQLKKSLSKLGTKITYSLKNVKSKRSGFFVLFSWVYVSNGMCYFAYSQKFKQLVYYPKIANFLNKKGITCAQQLLYPPKNPFMDMTFENLNYYTRIISRTNTFINNNLYF